MSNAEAIKRLRLLETVSYMKEMKLLAMSSVKQAREHAKDAEALRMAVAAMEKADQ